MGVMESKRLAHDDGCLHIMYHIRDYISDWFSKYDLSSSCTALGKI